MPEPRPFTQCRKEHGLPIMELCGVQMFGCEGIGTHGLQKRPVSCHYLSTESTTQGLMVAGVCRRSSCGNGFGVSAYRAIEVWAMGCIFVEARGRVREGGLG